MYPYRKNESYKVELEELQKKHIELQNKHLALLDKHIHLLGEHTTLHDRFIAELESHKKDVESANEVLKKYISLTQLVEKVWADIT